MKLWLISAACVAIMLASLTMFMRRRHLIELFAPNDLNIPPQVFDGQLALKWSSIPSYTPPLPPSQQQQAANALPAPPAFKPPKHLAAASGYHCPLSPKYLSSLTGTALTNLETSPLTSQSTNKNVLKEVEYPAGHMQRVLDKRIDEDLVQAIKEWEWEEAFLQDGDMRMPRPMSLWIVKDLNSEAALYVENPTPFVVTQSRVMATLISRSKDASLYVCEWVLYRQRSHAFHIVSTFVSRRVEGTAKSSFTWIASKVMGTIPEYDMVVSKWIVEPRTPMEWNPLAPSTDTPEIINMSFEQETNLYCNQQASIQKEHQIQQMFSDPTYTCAP